MNKALRLFWLFCLLISFAPSAMAASEDFTLLPGDIMQITVWKEDGLDLEVLVLQDGTINFPLIGSVQAKGLTPVKLQNIIKEKLKDSVPDASVTVAIKNPAGHTVSVIGQVMKPGEIILSHHMTVMQALSDVGGLTPYASEDISVIREKAGQKTTLSVPYDDIVRGKKLDEDVQLEAGDVIVVPTDGLF